MPTIEQIQQALVDAGQFQSDFVKSTRVALPPSRSSIADIPLPQWIEPSHAQTYFEKLKIPSRYTVYDTKSLIPAASAFRSHPGLATA